MNDLKLDKIIYIGIQLLFLSLIGFAIYTLSIPYEGILSYINSFRPEKPYQFFTEEYSLYFKMAVKLFIFLIIIFIIFLSFKKKLCISLIKSLLKEIRYYSFRLWDNTRSFFQSENKIHITILFSILLTGTITRLMYINRSVFHDEAKTFYSFISKSWVDTISNYYTPNNHVLHSILSRVFYVLLGNEEWVFRLPVFIFGIFTIIFIYIFSRRFYNRHVALIVSAISTNAISLVFYSVNARGYIIITFFFLILLCIIKSNKEKDSALLWIIFIIISSLGMWTIPTMSMPIILLFIWYIANSTRTQLLSNVLILSLVGLACLLLSIIFYGPVIIRCTIGSIISNEYVQSQNLGAIISNIPNLFIQLWILFTSGYSYVARIIILLFVLAGLFYHYSYKAHRKLLITIPLFLVIVFFVLKRLPYDRTLLFIYPIVAVIVGSGIFSLCRFISVRFKTNMDLTVNLVSIFFFLTSTKICLGQGGIIENYRVLTCPQAEKIIIDIKKSLRPNDIIETSTPLAGPIRYYILKNKIDEKQFYWHSWGKDKSSLLNYDNIYVITREDRNSLKSFGYTTKSSIEGYTPPEIWKEYDDTVKLYVIRRFL
tara:strand:+ start:753 stop:2546 length:1794 start_codon:yes stop_codon:yes gene_type:complete